MTPSQQHAIQCPDSDILCVAGAGSGKTAVLTSRVARVIAEGADPKSLMVLTFTKKAAGEMKARIAAATGDPDAMNGAMMGTFHSVCLKILQAYGDRIGYDGNTLGVIEPDDADALLEQCARDLGLFRSGKWGKGLSGKAVRKALEACYSSGVDAADDDAGRIIRAYWHELRQLNLLDFGLILRLANQLFRDHPDVLAMYRERVKFVFVDELQDSDAVQFTLHDWFAGTAAFFGVGDVRQTIYLFRGACPHLMRERHPNATVIELAENFRSGARIVDAANRLIACGPDRVAPMVAAKDGGYIEAMPGRTDDIVRRVGMAVGAFGPGNCAVIARSHRTLRRIEGRMRDQGVPCYRVGQRWDITDAPEFKTLHRAMRLVVNPRDQLAFMLLLDQFGMTTGDYAKCRMAAAQSGRPILEEASGWGGPLINRIEFLADVGELTAGVAVRELAMQLGSSNSVVDFWSPVADLPLKGALDWYGTRDRDAENEDAPKDKVTLLTAHSAKGLEWKFVMVAECNEASFPSSSAIREGTIDDERRVMYVAMTRAKDVLVCHYRQPEDQAEERTISEPSRFLFEAGLLTK